MGPADVERVAALSGELGYPSSASEMKRRFEGLAELGDHGVFVAEKPGAGVIGWIHVRLCHALDSDPSAEIAALVVTSVCRRLGAGRALVLEAERWASGRGLDRLRVRSNVTRPDSHEFYPALGFVLSKTQRQYTKRLAP